MAHVFRSWSCVRLDAGLQTVGVQTTSGMDQPVQSGVLARRSTVLGRWTKRWCELRGAVFTFNEDSKPGVIESPILARAVSVASASSKGKTKVKSLFLASVGPWASKKPPFGFQLVDSQSQIHVFRALDIKSYNEWLMAFSRAGLCGAPATLGISDAVAPTVHEDRSSVADVLIPRALMRVINHSDVALQIGQRIMVTKGPDAVRCLLYAIDCMTAATTYPESMHPSDGDEEELGSMVVDFGAVPEEDCQHLVATYMHHVSPRSLSQVLPKHVLHSHDVAIVLARAIRFLLPLLELPQLTDAQRQGIAAMMPDDPAFIAGDAGWPSTMAQLGRYSDYSTTQHDMSSAASVVTDRGEDDGLADSDAELDSDDARGYGNLSDTSCEPSSSLDSAPDPSFRARLAAAATRDALPSSPLSGPVVTAPISDIEDLEPASAGESRQSSSDGRTTSTSTAIMDAALLADAATAEPTPVSDLTPVSRVAPATADVVLEDKYQAAAAAPAPGTTTPVPAPTAPPAPTPAPAAAIAPARAPEISQPVVSHINGAAVDAARTPNKSAPAAMAAADSGANKTPTRRRMIRSNVYWRKSAGPVSSWAEVDLELTADHLVMHDLTPAKAALCIITLAGADVTPETSSRPYCFAVKACEWTNESGIHHGDKTFMFAADSQARLAEWTTHLFAAVKAVAKSQDVKHVSQRSRIESARPPATKPVSRPATPVFSTPVAEPVPFDDPTAPRQVIAPPAPDAAAVARQKAWERAVTVTDWQHLGALFAVCALIGVFEVGIAWSAALVLLYATLNFRWLRSLKAPLPDESAGLSHLAAFSVFSVWQAREAAGLAGCATIVLQRLPLVAAFAASSYLITSTSFHVLPCTAAVGLASWYWATLRKQQSANLQAAFAETELALATQPQPRRGPQVSVPSFVLRDLPAWVRQPDADRAQWLNRLIAASWPHLEAAISSSTSAALQPCLDFYQPSWASKLQLTQLTFGRRPLVITSATCADVAGLVPQQGVCLDLGVNATCDESQIIELKLALKGGVSMRVQLCDLSIVGRVRVIFSPFSNTWPCFSYVVVLGARWVVITQLLPCMRSKVSVSFAEPPTVSFHLLTVGVELTSLPVIKSWIHSLVHV